MVRFMTDEETEAELSLVRRRISELEITKTAGSVGDIDFADLRANAEHLHVGYRRYLEHLQNGGPMMEIGERFAIHLGHELTLIADSSEGSNWATQVEILLQCVACDQILDVFVASDDVIGSDLHAYDSLEPHVGHEAMFVAQRIGGNNHHVGGVDLVCRACEKESQRPVHLFGSEVGDWFGDLWLRN